MLKPGNHVDTLDGLRAVACLIVVFSHFPDFGFGLRAAHNSGHFGVMLFFALSGFLMAYLYLDREASYRNVGQYVVARAARIAPIYLIVVIGSWLIYQLVDPNFVYPITTRALFRHLLFSGNVSVLWSIPPEVQFYGLFILLWLAMGYARTKSNYLPITIMLIAIAVFILFGQNLPGTFVASKVHFFLAGMLVAIARKRIDASWWRGSWLLACQVIAAAIFFFMLLPYTLPYFAVNPNFYADLKPALVCGSLVWLLSYPTGPFQAALGNPVMRAIGAQSFSLYLLHKIVFYLSTRVADDFHWAHSSIWPYALAIALAASWASYKFIESPSRDFIRTRLGAWLEEHSYMDRLRARFLPRPSPAPVENAD